MPTFRGPIHHGAATSRPMWSIHPRCGLCINIHMASNPTALVHNHRWVPHSIPSCLNRLYILHLHPQAVPLHRTAIALPLRNHLLASHHLTSPVSRGYAITPCEIPKHGNQILSFTVPARSMAWTSPQPSDRASSPSAKTLRAWTRSRFLYGNSYARTCTTIGSEELLTAVKPIVIPFDNIGTTVFVAELVSQLRSRNIDLDRLAAYRSRNLQSLTERGHSADGEGRSPTHSSLASHYIGNWPYQSTTNLGIGDGTGQGYSGWYLLTPRPTRYFQQRWHDSNPTSTNYTEIHPPRPRSTRQSSWSPPARSIAWLEENQLPSLSDTSYKKCVKELKLPQHKAETLEKNIEKVMLMVAEPTWHSIEDCSTSQSSDGPGSSEVEVIHYGRVSPRSWRLRWQWARDWLPFWDPKAPQPNNFWRISALRIRVFWAWLCWLRLHSLRVFNFFTVAAWFKEFSWVSVFFFTF